MKQLKEAVKKLETKDRLYQLNVPIIGLTGGIATGKSTVSKMLINEDIPLIDADQLVKDVYAEEIAQEYIRKNHPEAWKGNAIHFPTLREKFFNDRKAKEEIEKFIYARLPDAFGKALKKLGNPSFIVYDVPLLFEKQLQTKVDLTVLVYAPRKIQAARIMNRDGHLQEMAETILSHQLDIEDKRSKADLVVDNSRGIDELAVEVKSFLRQVLAN